MFISDFGCCRTINVAYNIILKHIQIKERSQFHIFMSHIDV